MWDVVGSCLLNINELISWFLVSKSLSIKWTNWTRNRKTKVYWERTGPAPQRSGHMGVPLHTGKKAPSPTNIPCHSTESRQKPLRLLGNRVWHLSLAFQCCPSLLTKKTKQDKKKKKNRRQKCRTTQAEDIIEQEIRGCCIKLKIKPCPGW